MARNSLLVYCEHEVLPWLVIVVPVFLIGYGKFHLATWYCCCRVRLYRKLPLGLAISGSSSLFSFMIITRCVFFGGCLYSYSLHYINLVANSFAIIGSLCILFLIIILVRVFAITGVSFVANTFNYRDRSFAITGALRIHYWLLLGLNPQTLAESVVISIIGAWHTSCCVFFVRLYSFVILPLGLVVIVCLSGSS